MFYSCKMLRLLRVYFSMGCGWKQHLPVSILQYWCLYVRTLQLLPSEGAIYFFTFSNLDWSYHLLWLWECDGNPSCNNKQDILGACHISPDSLGGLEPPYEQVFSYLSTKDRELLGLASNQAAVICKACNTWMSGTRPEPSGMSRHQPTAPSVGSGCLVL